MQFSAAINGRLGASRWNFGDGTVVSNQPVAMHAWATLGDHTVVLTAFNESNPGGVRATTIVHIVEAPVHYVASWSANPVAPYASWATAARTIQDAIDVATMPGALVLVGNGEYATGGRAVYASWLQFRGLTGAEKRSFQKT